MTPSYRRWINTTELQLHPMSNKWDLLSFEEHAKAFVHRGFVLSSIDLAFLQRLDGAELSCEPLKQVLLNMEGFKHPLVD